MKISKKSLLRLFLLPIAFLLFPSQVEALPGQSTEEVGSWIKNHPTLKPNSRERFYIQKSDTAAQRFTFQASVLPPGAVGFTRDRSNIRTERLAMYDAINGMSFDRLQESLRIIYGLDVYQDFANAQLIYDYPNQSAINSARLARTPIREALRGELRVGDRYAYWMEIAKGKNGKAYTGQMTVLLKSDLNKLEAELRNR
ncbi:hypothetical protein NIES4101_54660 [Calothrix sp. NIES-4101]|nr:hypothetical protein NIES4101_54660 [Calothrix sp. NIES-4101]